MLTSVSFIYLIAAVCFILALKGLASPATARQGNYLGIFGMTLAILATFLTLQIDHIWLLLLLILSGGGVGTWIALKIKMTAIPQLVAGFHSLVGLAAVLVALCAFLSPQSFHIGLPDAIATSSLVEMSLGLIIGAITFAGSIIAFLKLQGLMSGKPLRFKGQVLFNSSLAIALLCLFLAFLNHQSLGFFILIALLSLALGTFIILPIGGADMPVVISMLNSYSGWACATAIP